MKEEEQEPGNGQPTVEVPAAHVPAGTLVMPPMQPAGPLPENLFSIPQSLLQMVIDYIQNSPTPPNVPVAIPMNLLNQLNNLRPIHIVKMPNVPKDGEEKVER